MTGSGDVPATGRRRWGRRRVVPAVAVVLVVVVTGWLVGRQLLGDEEVGTVATDNVTGGVAVSQISKADLEKAARTRVFFGHQSVGMNILDGLPQVYAAQGVTEPPVEHTRQATAATGGFLAETLIGENTQPLQKIRDFDAVIRGGTGRQIDVAVLKLCYIDITPGTDVDAVFAAYRDTITALEKDFPQVTFVKATVPLTTRPPLLSKLKQRVRGNEDYGASANATRERLNELIRKEYAGDHLFDVAAVESTAPDGSRVSGRTGDRPFFALYDGYAADPGHLNAEGSRRAATAFLAAIARASSR